MIIFYLIGAVIVIIVPYQTCQEPAGSDDRPGKLEDHWFKGKETCISYFIVMIILFYVAHWIDMGRLLYRYYRGNIF